MNDAFSFAYQGKKLVGNGSGSIVFLHGGKAGRSVFEEVRAQLLNDVGFESIALDFLGQGESDGEMRESSLQSRTEQVEELLRVRRIVDPLMLVGFSMGAVNAIKLTESRRVEKLVLLVPGVYDAAVYTQAFDEHFTAAIRKEGSWEKTDAWEILGNYEGDLLIIQAEHDIVVPKEIPERFYASATHARSRRLVVLPDAEHTIFNTHTNELVALLREFLCTTSPS